jgi:hypothetical protein
MGENESPLSKERRTYHDFKSRVSAVPELLEASFSA